MRRLILAVLLIPAACVPVPPRSAVAPAPRFNVDAFFAGRTEGIGTLRIAFKPPVKTIVHGRGRLDGDALVLEQTVVQGSASPRERAWRIRMVAPGRYTGTLTDASGPVTGTVEGNRLHLTFAMTGGLTADQKLDLAADGASAHNIMVIRKFGIVVASLDEDIRKTP